MHGYSVEKKNYQLLYPRDWSEWTAPVPSRDKSSPVPLWLKIFCPASRGALVSTPPNPLNSCCTTESVTPAESRSHLRKTRDWTVDGWMDRWDGDHLLPGKQELRIRRREWSYMQWQTVCEWREREYSLHWTQQICSTLLQPQHILVLHLLSSSSLSFSLAGLKLSSRSNFDLTLVAKDTERERDRTRRDGTVSTHLVHHQLIFPRPNRKKSSLFDCLRRCSSLTTGTVKRLVGYHVH